jgi:sugar lactone lactonase YvrE
MKSPPRSRASSALRAPLRPVAAAPTGLVFGLAAWVALATACGEPISVIGDTPGLMRVVAGVPEQQGRDVSDRATQTELRYPGGVSMDLDGVLYVADTDNKRLLAVTSSGELRVIVDDLLCVANCLVRATDVAVDGTGGLIVADVLGHRVWRFDRATGARTLLAGDGQNESGPDGDPAISSSVQGPRGVAVGPTGEVYFSESRGHRVRTILPDGTLATVAGIGVAGFGGDGGPATEAGIDFPGGLDVAEGILYIADAGNNRIRAVDLSSGTISTIAGSGVRGLGGDGGSPLGAQLSLPRDVAATSNGRTLYVADAGNHRIRVVMPASDLINTFSGTGETEYNGNLLDAGATALHNPLGVATSPFGLVLIADTNHHIVRRTPTGF